MGAFRTRYWETVEQLNQVGDRLKILRDWGIAADEEGFFGRSAAVLKRIYEHLSKHSTAEIAEWFDEVERYLENVEHEVSGNIPVLLNQVSTMVEVVRDVAPQAYLHYTQADQGSARSEFERLHELIETSGRMDHPAEYRFFIHHFFDEVIRFRQASLRDRFAELDASVLAEASGLVGDLNAANVIVRPLTSRGLEAMLATFMHNDAESVAVAVVAPTRRLQRFFAPYCQRHGSSAAVTIDAETPFVAARIYRRGTPYVYVIGLNTDSRFADFASHLQTFPAVLFIASEPWTERLNRALLTTLLFVRKEHVFLRVPEDEPQGSGAHFFQIFLPSCQAGDRSADPGTVGSLIDAVSAASSVRPAETGNVPLGEQPVGMEEEPVGDEPDRRRRVSRGRNAGDESHLGYRRPEAAEDAVMDMDAATRDERRRGTRAVMYRGKRLRDDVEKDR